MSDPRGTHNDLHSERGALAGEHSGRATNPVIKVHDLAWLGFQKPDLARAETFAHAFGFATVVRTASDAMAAGGQYLIDQGYYRSWGIGRHIQGSQIFDYWRDPDGFLVEHFADGRQVRLHPRAGMGADDRLRSGAVGATGHPRLPGRRTGHADAQ